MAKPYTAKQRERIVAAITGAVERTTPGPVLAADLLVFERAGLRAARMRWPQVPTAAELAWVREVVADAVATREAESHR
jgi:hypothetical protein